MQTLYVTEEGFPLGSTSSFKRHERREISIVALIGWRNSRVQDLAYVS
jgi:hypothetical protein